MCFDNCLCFLAIYREDLIPDELLGALTSSSRFITTLLLSGQHDFIQLLRQAPIMYPEPQIIFLPPISPTSTKNQRFSSLTVSHLPDAALIFEGPKKHGMLDYAFACEQLVTAVEKPCEHYQEWIHEQFEDGDSIPVDRSSDAVWLLVPERRGEWYRKAFAAHKKLVEKAMRYGDVLNVMRSYGGLGAVLLLSGMNHTALADSVWDDINLLDEVVEFLDVRDLLQPLEDVLKGNAQLIDVDPFDKRDSSLRRYLWRLIHTDESTYPHQNEDDRLITCHADLTRKRKRKM